MKRLIVTAVAAVALVVAATASAALVPWTYALNPADAGCVTSTFSGGVLHLAKNCPTATVVSAGATITGVSGTFSSASFTLTPASQCNGGSRFNVVTTNGTTS
jgi:hypothetical protein